MQLHELTTRKFLDGRANYTRRDTMLYALGVAACQDPSNTRDLSFVYESDLQALPSLCCVLAPPPPWLGSPELKIDYVKLVHAEQSFELTKPLPAEGEVISRFRITAVVDKGKKTGALVYLEKSLFNLNDVLLGTTRSTLFLRGDGGCGNWGSPDPELFAVPASAPVGSIDTPTLTVAALIYRLSGDYNPLHADPAIAEKAGFGKPILHGLCTYGIACHSLMRALCDSDATRLTGMRARFTKPVWPGETLRTEYWSATDGQVQFRSRSVERDEIVLDRGMATLRTAGT